MNSAKKGNSKLDTFGFTRQGSQMPQELNSRPEIMPLNDFLHHLYQVIYRYIKNSDDLTKVFNLYVIQTKKTKAEVDYLRKAYVDSLNEYSRKDSEVAYCLSLLKKNDKEAIDFLMKGKKKILLFFDIGENNMGYPLSKIGIKVSEWINLLKSFSFFGSENLSRKIESFKQFVIEENENFLEISGAEFLKAVYCLHWHIESMLFFFFGEGYPGSRFAILLDFVYFLFEQIYVKGIDCFEEFGSAYFEKILIFFNNELFETFDFSG